MSANAVAFLDAATAIAGLVPVAGPILVAGLGLVRSLVSSGATVQDIERIKIDALRTLIAAANARIDARAAAHDASTQPPGSDPDIYPED